MNSRSIVSNGIHIARRLVATLAVAGGVGGFVAQPAVANGPTSRAYDETGVRDVLSGAATMMPAAILPTTSTRALTRSPQARARAHRTRQRATTAAALSPIAMPTEHIARAALVPFSTRDAGMLVLGAFALAACGAALVTAGVQRQRRDPDRYDGL